MRRGTFQTAKREAPRERHRSAGASRRAYTLSVCARQLRDRGSALHRHKQGEDGMKTDRRTVIATGAAMTTLLATGASAQQPTSRTADPAKGPSELMEVIHVWADEKGVSHVDRIRVKGSPKRLPA